MTVTTVVEAVLALANVFASQLPQAEQPEFWTKLKLEITKGISLRDADVALDEAEESRVLKEGP